MDCFFSLKSMIIGVWVTLRI